MSQAEIIKSAVANAIIDKLWIMGLLSDEERDKIKELNMAKYIINY